jgi:hypothetical protein
MSSREPGSVPAMRFVFPTDRLGLADFARALRYFDYVWGDAAQLDAWAGYRRIPPRPAAARPMVTGLRMESPLTVQVAEHAVGAILGAGGVGWLVKLAVTDPASLTTWLTRVKTAGHRERAELARAEAKRMLAEADRDRVLRELLLRRESEQDSEMARSAPFREPRVFAPRPPLQVVPELEPDWPGSGLQPSLLTPRSIKPETAEGAVNRMESDAWHLLDLVGPPEIEDMEILPPGRDE